MSNYSFDSIFKNSPKTFRNYKCNYPTATIANIKRILDDVGIETEVEEIQRHKNLYSTIIWTKNREFHLGYGKGSSKELAIASGYAEVIERIQNRPKNIFGQSGRVVPKSMNDISSSYPESVSSTSKELIKKFNLQFNEKRYFQVVNLRFEKKDWLNHEILGYVGTNGMAAGNTIEEASVQAICEIFERYVQKEIIRSKKCITFPTIDLKAINNRELHQCVELMNENGIDLIFKDLSLGMKLPVVGALFLEAKTGDQLAMSIQAFPSQQEALIRCFTESAQASSLDLIELRKSRKINDEVFEIIIKDFPDERQNTELLNFYMYQECASKTIENNHTLRKIKKGRIKTDCLLDYSDNDCKIELVRLLDLIPKQFHDIFFRNSSWLGFPSVHFIIPDFSFVLDSLSSKTPLHIRNQWFEIDNLINRKKFIKLVEKSKKLITNRFIEHPNGFPLDKFYSLEMINGHFSKSFSFDYFLGNLAHYHGLIDLREKMLRLNDICITKFKSVFNKGNYQYCKAIFAYVQALDKYEQNEELALKEIQDKFSIETIDELKSEFVNKENIIKNLNDIVPNCGNCEECLHSDYCYYYLKGRHILKRLSKRYSAFLLKENAEKLVYKK